MNLISVKEAAYAFGQWDPSSKSTASEAEGEALHADLLAKMKAAWESGKDVEHIADAAEMTLQECQHICDSFE